MLPLFKYVFLVQLVYLLDHKLLNITNGSR